MKDDTKEAPDDSATSLDETFETFNDETADQTAEDSSSEDETDSSLNDLEDVPEEHQREKEEAADPWRYVNKFDRPVRFTCPRGRALNFIASVHSNHHEDRRFALACTSKAFHFRRSFKTRTLNRFDKPVSYSCPSGYVLTGVASYHHNYYEDRVWRVRCSQLITGSFKKSCRWTSYTNWDARWSVRAPKGSFITGMNSYHSNHYEDRRYRFEICSFSKNCNIY